MKSQLLLFRIPHSAFRISVLAALLLTGSCYQAMKRAEEGPDPALQTCAQQHGLEPFTHYFGLLYPTPPAGDLANVAKLDQQVYRGARPTHLGLCQLKAMGIKTIVSLENLDNVVAWEKANSQKLGIGFVNLPLSIFRAPTQPEVAHFFSLVNDPGLQPVYFHCMQGSDRTGTMGFLYRVKQQGWDYATAYAELVRHGFHTYLGDLRHFIEQFQQPVPQE